MQRIKVAAVQMEVMPGKIEANLGSVKHLLEKICDIDVSLVVLPEMWATGFRYKHLESLVSETPDILATVMRWTRSYETAIIGTLPEKGKNGKIYNTAYLIGKNGRIMGNYRKIHLFSLHGEEQYFERGTRHLVCKTEKGNIGVITCYDLRFPELSRVLALQGAEIIAIGAQWPKPRIDHWRILVRARAIENQLFIIAANICGKDKRFIYGGHSMIVSPTGKVLAEAKTHPEILIAELRPEEMTEFRKVIPCFSDRVPDAYHLH